MTDGYQYFLEQKVSFDHAFGFEAEASAINPLCKPHQSDIIRWAIRGGRRAIFAAFGLGKSFMQLEILRIILVREGGRALIIAPLGVRQEFIRDAAKLGIPITFVRRSAEVVADGIYITNYESVRDGKLDINLLVAVSLDEASCLRGFGGTKTFREFMRLFEFNRNNRYRFVATATPSPNQYIELLAYAAFLEVMDIGQAKTRFFKRDSEKADALTLLPHKEKEFWLWVNTWAVFVQAPSDLGYSDEGYALPPLDVRWHKVGVDHSSAGAERDGQGRLFRNAAIGVRDAAREKRDSITARVAKMVEIIRESPDDHFVLWHDLEDERRAIKSAVPEAVEVYGSMDLDEREDRVVAFSDGQSKYLATKPKLSGSGCNFQRHCHREIFVGIGFKFNDAIQAVHRVQRFLQEHPVRIDFIYTESESEIRKTFEAKWARHKELVTQMTDVIKQYGLNAVEMCDALKRSIGVERIEITGRDYKLVNNDAVLETRAMPDNSVGLIVTSIPFSTQYEYSPSYNDFGHTDNNEHFWAQMDFLIPELLRVLQPGRIAAIHVKDRIVPGGLTGLGFQTVYPFSDDCRMRFQKHGFAFLCRKTIVTDVVRENNQTYRLGYTEQCKDGSRMGAGMPEYLMIFRKPPSDRSNGYADLPVSKSKVDYSLSKWQLDAHGFERSSGNRPLAPSDLDGVEHNVIFKLFREYSLNNVYDFEHHVKLGDHLELRGILPVTFMLLQPQSWSPDVWTDVARMRTLNMLQEAKGKEMHLCPLQFDIAERVINQCSMPGETVYDPFGGIMTVPYCAIKLKRKAIATELNPGYFIDGAHHCASIEREMSTPTLFDLINTKRGRNAA